MINLRTHLECSLIQEILQTQTGAERSHGHTSIDSPKVRIPVNDPPFSTLPNFPTLWGLAQILPPWYKASTD